LPGSIYLKGGIPRIIDGSAPPTAPGKFEIKGGVANFLAIENLDLADDLYWYPSAEDYSAGRYFIIPAVVGSVGNPLLVPAEAAVLWFMASGATAINFKVLAFLRRG
jgi:hypothetical protein